MPKPLNDPCGSFVSHSAGRTPYVVLALLIAVLGVTSVLTMPMAVFLAIDMNAPKTWRGFRLPTRGSGSGSPGTTRALASSPPLDGQFVVWNAILMRQAVQLEHRRRHRLARRGGERRQQGRTEAARGLLAPAYARWTEGFHRADAREAWTLLDSLG